MADTTFVKNLLQKYNGAWLRKLGAETARHMALALDSALETRLADVGSGSGGGIGDTLAFDSFTRADSDSLGSTETGAFAWTEGNEDFDIVSNAMTIPSGSNEGWAYIDPGESDVLVSVTCKAATDDSWGLIVRGSDINNYLILNFFTGDGGLRFYEKNAGVFTALAAAYALSAPVVGDIISIRAFGVQLTAYLNGAQLGTIRTSFNQSATKCGIRSVTAHSATRQIFDDFTVKEAVAL